jgi:DNA-binding CsgD family transcriptional regulator
MHGRQREWSAVLDLLTRAKAGNGGVLLVDGELGMGKSLLLTEASDAAVAQGFAVVAAAADELGRLMPLAPLLAAIGDSALAALAPDLGPGLPDARMWLISRLQTRLEKLASENPALVSLDDLQWADPVTLLALRTLPRQLASYPLIWVLARSTGQGGDTRRLFELLERDGAIRISLLPLTDATVGELVMSELGAKPDPELLELAEGALGNPFMLGELIGGLRDEGAIEISEGRASLVSTQVPRRIQLFVRDRVGLLSSQARQLLEAAAVLGRSFAVEDVAEMLGETPTALVPALEEALASGVVVPWQDSIAFRHDLLWHAVADAMPRAVRSALHRQFGDILLRRGGSAIPAAAHLVEGARRGDIRALAGLDRAASEVLPSSPQTAADLATRALDLTLPADPDRVARSLAAIEALTAALRLEEATELVGAMLSSALPAAARAQLRCVLSSILRLTGHPAEARAEAEGVLTEQGLPGRLRDEAKIALLRALVDLNDQREADSQAKSILAAPEDSGNDVIVGAFAVRAAIRWDEGSVGEALDLSREAVMRVNGGPLDARGFQPHLALAGRLVDIRQFEEARAIIGAATSGTGVDDGDAPGQVSGEVSSGILRARMDLAAGKLDEAAAEAEGILSVSGALGTRPFISLAESILCIVALRRGDLRAAEQHLEGAGEGQPLPGRHVRERYAMLAAQLVEARDGPQAAVEQFAAVFDEISADRWLLVSDPATASWLVRVALAAGDYLRAEHVAAVADEIAVDNQAFPVVIYAAAHARGILDHNVAFLGQAAQGHADPWARASAAEDQGQLLALTNVRGAIECLDHALGGYEWTGATRDAARVRRRLRRLGVRKRHWTTTERPVQGWGSLTGAERSISLLVTQGLTNRQIAERMFVSAHTVAFHLRQIFRKLSIGSRVELARLAVEQDHGPDHDQEAELPRALRESA